MQPEIYTLMVWLTLGIALVLVIVPNICAVLWAKIAVGYFFPAANDLKQLGIAGTLLFAIVFGPAFLAKVKADSVMSNYVQSDFNNDVPASPVHIKFLYDGSNGGSASRYCDYICQDLFLTGPVKSLTYETQASYRRGNSKDTRRTHYKIGKGKACQTDIGQTAADFKKPARRAILDLIAEGQCILKSKKTTQVPDVTITQSAMHRKDLAQANKSAPLFMTYERIATRSIRDKSGKVLVSQADIQLGRPFLPSFFAFAGSGERIRLDVMKTHDKSIEAPLELWGMQKLYPNISVQREHVKRTARPIAPSRDETVDEGIARANKVLDEAPANKEINGSHLKILSSGLRQKSYNSALRTYESESDPVINLALRILADQRVQDVSTLRSAFFFLRRGTTPYDGDVNALIFDRLKTAKMKEKAVTLELLKLVPLDARRSEGAMIMRAFNEQTPEDIKNTYSYAGNLGVSPVRLFNTAINDFEDWTVLSRVANGIRCSDPQWRKALIPSLDKMIEQHAEGGGSRRASATAIWTLNESWKTPTALSQKHRASGDSKSSCR